jgi:hypothetical protein
MNEVSQLAATRSGPRCVRGDDRCLFFTPGERSRLSENVTILNGLGDGYNAREEVIIEAAEEDIEDKVAHGMQGEGVVAVSSTHARLALLSYFLGPSLNDADNG